MCVILLVYVVLQLHKMNLYSNWLYGALKEWVSPTCNPPVNPLYPGYREDQADPDRPKRRIHNDHIKTLNKLHSGFVFINYLKEFDRSITNIILNNICKTLPVLHVFPPLPYLLYDLYDPKRKCTTSSEITVISFVAYSHM